MVLLSIVLQAETRVRPYGAKVYHIVSAISKLRGSVGNGKDQGIVKPSQSNIVPTDGAAASISYVPWECSSHMPAAACDAAKPLLCYRAVPVPPVICHSTTNRDQK